MIPLMALGATEAALVDECVGGGWTAAEARAVHQEPITGITAELGTLDPNTHFTSCIATDDYEGWSAAFVNLSRYDRRYARGGDLIQLGIWRKQKEPLTFAYTEDNTNGGLIVLPKPYPQAGRSYSFTIALRGETWVLTISDEGTVLHEVVVQAHWFRAETAWLMFETFDLASPLAGAVAARAPVLSGPRLHLPSGIEAAALGGCSTYRIWQDGETYQFAPADLPCTVLDGSFSATNGRAGGGASTVTSARP